MGRLQPEINSISTRNREVVVTFKGRIARMTELDIADTLLAKKSIVSELERKLGIPFDIPIEIHRNRDGTIAAAKGEIVHLLRAGKALWPEDEKLILGRELAERRSMPIIEVK